MALHPGERKRHVPEQLPVAWDPIRRALEESEDWYRDLVEHSQDLLCVHDLQGRILSVNPVPARLLGYSVEEVMRKPLRDFVDPQFHDQFDAYLREIERAAEARGLMAVVTRSGEKRIWEYHSTLRTEGVVTPIVRTIGHDVTERVRAEKALRESELRFRAVYERSPIGIALVDSRSGRFLQVNPKFCEIAGRREEELLRIDVGSITHPDDIGQTSEFLRQLAEEKLASYKMDKRYLRPDGSVRWVRILVVPMWGKGGKRRWHMGLVEDITEQKRAQEAQCRLNRELRAISNCNQTLLRAVDEQTLLNDICRIVCDEAGYRMAWVGYAQHDEAKTVRPIAWAGVEDGYLAAANVSWADTERGRGPGGAAIRNGASVYIQDFPTDPRFAPWRENALQCGYRSAISVPLKDDNANTFGELAIYSAEPNAFTPDEIRLLEGLAGDLAFGITVMRARVERKRAEEAIATLVQRVRADSSENFFNSMAIQLAKCLEADYTIIGELIEGEEWKVRTIGVRDHGLIAENFTYDLVHTPSEAVMRQGACSYAAGVSEMFPKDLRLKQMNIEGYAGTPLLDSQGRAIGIMVAAYTRPLANAKFPK